MKNRKVVEIKYHDNGEKYRPSKCGYYVEICNLFQCRMEQKKREETRRIKIRRPNTIEPTIQECISTVHVLMHAIPKRLKRNPKPEHF